MKDMLVAVDYWLQKQWKWLLDVRLSGFMRKRSEELPKQLNFGTS